MAEQVSASEVSIALDMKKNRIRIHKPTVHMLGDPKLIQLLFDPEDIVVAIVCPESEVPGGQEIRINPKYFKRGENDVEVFAPAWAFPLVPVNVISTTVRKQSSGSVQTSLPAETYQMKRANI